MQDGIPVAYNVCEVKLDKTNHWICVQREDFHFRWYINLLEPEFYILILAHPVGKMRIIQEPNKVAL